MFRYILDLIVVVVIITLLRSVLGVLLKLFTGGFAGASNAGQTPKRPSVPAGGELKKDPVCGTFIAAATSIQKTIRGETYYFCSTVCRDKFKA